MTCLMHEIHDFGRGLEVGESVAFGRDGYSVILTRVSQRRARVELDAPGRHATVYTSRREAALLRTAWFPNEVLFAPKEASDG